MIHVGQCLTWGGQNREEVVRGTYREGAKGSGNILVLKLLVLTLNICTHADTYSLNTRSH